jgi:uncharacterized membrane protein YkvA (DUF1232 family)
MLPPDSETAPAGAQSQSEGRRESQSPGPRFWTKLKAVLAHLPWADRLLAAYYCATDPATPPAAKATLLAALGYFVLPFDAVPDLLVAIGFADDLAVLLLALRAVQTHLTPEHEARARAKLAELQAGQPGP